MTTLASQASYIATLPGGLQFPTAAVELKVDWLPATSVNGDPGRPGVVSQRQLRTTQ